MPDTDWTDSGEQNLSDAHDFSGAQILPYKKVKALDLKIYNRIG